MVTGGAGPAAPADVRIRGDRIVEVGANLHVGDAQVLDAGSLVVMPGFVDAHVHGDSGVLLPEVMAAMNAQGVTSVVLGQDGVSFAPGGEHGAARRYAEDYFGAVNGPAPAVAGGGVADLLAAYHRTTSVNTAYLVPHGTLRYAVMGGADRVATPAEVRSMCALLERGLLDGARGMSTGLEYAPASYADRVELTALCQVVARHGLPHVSHMRGYEERAQPALRELVDIAAASGVATHVSHLHGPAAPILAEVDAARAAGIDLTFDTYPYLRGATILAMVALPAWLPLADPAGTVALLREEPVLTRLLVQLEQRADLWPRITLASVPHPAYRWAEGRLLVDVAHMLGESPERTAVRLLVATRLATGCVFEQPETNSLESVRELMRHPAHLASSDGIYLGSHPHPRGWGAFARFLAVHTRKLGDWTLPEAAQHLASSAARRFGLTDRGMIAPGRYADVVVLDPEEICDRATYQEPRNLAAGVRAVLVNGVAVIHDGDPTGALPGRAIR